MRWGPWPNATARKSEEAGKQEKPEINKIRKPEHAGPPKPAELRIGKPENHGIWCGGALAQLGAKQSKQAGKHENPEITEIRKPEHTGTQKPAKLRVAGPENPGVGRCGWAMAKQYNRAERKHGNKSTAID